MKDQVGPAGDRPLRRAGHREIDGSGDELDSAARGRIRLSDVGERQTRDDAATERAVLGESHGQLAADHARRTCAKDMHRRVCRHSAMPPSTRWACPVM
jgi:hypothetical protein